MEQKRKLNVVISDTNNKEYVDFLSLYYDINVIDITTAKNNKKSIDLVVFTTGEDINPKHYGEEKGEFTRFNEQRDNKDIDLFFTFQSTPKVGFGRGAQLIAMLCGAKLIQHCVGHDKEHSISVNGIGAYNVESNHHQLIFPYNVRKDYYTVLGWSKQFQSDTYLDGNNKEIELPKEFLEIEIVKFGLNLAIQPHAHTTKNKDFQNICINMIDKILERDHKYFNEELKKRGFDYEFYSYDEPYPGIGTTINIGNGSNPEFGSYKQFKDQRKVVQEHRGTGETTISILDPLTGKRNTVKAKTGSNPIIYGDIATQQNPFDNMLKEDWRNTEKKDSEEDKELPI